MHLDFVRLSIFYLRLFSVLSILMLPILLPINLTVPSEISGATGLDRLSHYNIPATHADRLWVHVIMAYLVFGFTLFSIRSEMLSYLFLHAAAANKSSFFLMVGSRDVNAKRPVGLLQKYVVPGVHLVDVSCDPAACMDPARLSELLEEVEAEMLQPTIADGQDSEDRLLARLGGLLHFNKRHRIPNAIRRIGRIFTHLRDYAEEIKVQYERGDMTKLALAHTSTHQERTVLESVKLGSVSLYRTDEAMTNILWHNVLLRSNPSSTRSLLIRILALVSAVLLAVPVSFQGLLSQLGHFLVVIGVPSDYVSPRQTWLVAYFQGVVPQMLSLAFVFFSPILIRRLVYAQKWATFDAQESSLQKHIFLYLFLQIFVFVSISASLTVLLSTLIRNPSQALELLGRDLPRAANYYISYIIMQGLVLATVAMVDWKMLINLYVLSKVRRLTLRRFISLGQYSEVSWPLVFPSMTIVGCIGIIYSVTSPIVLPCCSLSFALMLWAFAQRSYPAKPLCFGSASSFFVSCLFQTFVGLYMMEFYLISTFFALIHRTGRTSSFFQGLFIWALLFLTALFHFKLWLEVRARSAQAMHSLRDGEFALDLRLFFRLMRFRRDQTVNVDDDEEGADPYLCASPANIIVGTKQQGRLVDLSATLHLPNNDENTFHTVNQLSQAVHVGLLSLVGTIFERKVSLVLQGALLTKSGSLEIRDLDGARKALQNRQMRDDPSGTFGKG